MPLNQHTFNYFDVRGKGLLIILYTKGSVYTIMARIIGMESKIVKAINMALHLLSIDKIDAPKYAKTKA